MLALPEGVDLELNTYGATLYATMSAGFLHSSDFRGSLRRSSTPCRPDGIRRMSAAATDPSKPPLLRRRDRYPAKVGVAYRLRDFILPGGEEGRSVFLLGRGSLLPMERVSPEGEGG
ncbi:hypothetical protein MRX96_055863 [Rhipicephalus microplus]